MEDYLEMGSCLKVFKLLKDIEQRLELSATPQEKTLLQLDFLRLENAIQTIISMMVEVGLVNSCSAMEREVVDILQKYLGQEKCGKIVSSADEEIQDVVDEYLIVVAEIRIRDELTLRLIRIALEGEAQDLHRKVSFFQSLVNAKQIYEKKHSDALSSMLDEFEKRNANGYPSYEFMRQLNIFTGQCIMQSIGIDKEVRKIAEGKKEGKRPKYDDAACKMTDSCKYIGGSSKQAASSECSNGASSVLVDESRRRSTRMTRHVESGEGSASGFKDRTSKTALIYDKDFEFDPTNIVEQLQNMQRDEAQTAADFDGLEGCFDDLEDYFNDLGEIDPEYDEMQDAASENGKKRKRGLSLKKSIQKADMQKNPLGVSTSNKTFLRILHDLERQSGAVYWRSVLEKNCSQDFITELAEIVHSCMIIATSNTIVTKELWNSINMCPGPLLDDCRNVEMRGFHMSNRWDGGESSMRDSGKLVVDYSGDPLLGGVPYPCFKFETSLKCNQIKALQFFIRALAKSSKYKHAKVDQADIDQGFDSNARRSPLLGMHSFAVGEEMLPFMFYMLRTTKENSSIFSSNLKKSFIEPQSMWEYSAESKFFGSNIKGAGLIVSCRRYVRELLKTKCFMQFDTAQDKDSGIFLEVGKVAYTHGSETDTKRILSMYPVGGKRAAKRQPAKKFKDIECRFASVPAPGSDSLQTAVVMNSIDVEFPGDTGGGPAETRKNELEVLMQQEKPAAGSSEKTAVNEASAGSCREKGVVESSKKSPKHAAAVSTGSRQGAAKQIKKTRDVVGSRVVFQIDICSVKDGRLQKKGYFRGTITENNEVERKYVVEFDDGEEREFGYDEEPLEKVIAGDNEYVKECKSTEDFMSKSHK
jgi:hypothetical protein